MKTITSKLDLGGNKFIEIEFSAINVVHPTTEIRLRVKNEDNEVSLYLDPLAALRLTELLQLALSR